MLGYDKRNETRRRLLAAAADEFARHGFANARIRHIVDLAQVNLAAVNYHFGGKDGLYRATLEALATRSRGDESPAVPSDSPEERLRARVQSTLERFVLHPDATALGRILAHEAMNPTTHLDALVAGTLRPEIECFAALIGEVPGAPPEGSPELAFAAIGVIGQCLLFQFAGAALRQAAPALPEGPRLCADAARHIARSAVAGLPLAKGFSCKAPEAAL